MHLGKKSRIILKAAGIFFILVYLLFNAVASQIIDLSYFKIMDNNPGGYIELLKKIKRRPEFNYFHNIAQNILGDEIDQKIYAEETKNQLEINKMRQALKINPRATNVLYNLYLLYQKDNPNLAKYFLEEARMLNPRITN